MDVVDRLGRGRLFKPDDRDRKFMMPDFRREAAPVEHRYHITRGAAYDQGSTSQCVAYSGNRYLTTNPTVNEPLDFEELYRACQLVDEWEGGEYLPLSDPNYYEGTSVRALFKILKERGLVERYEWAWDAERVINHVLAVGPVVMGTDWLYSMFFPDPKTGLIKVEGQNVGGHAWTIVGASRKRQQVQLINSWGPLWGIKGRAWMAFEDLDKLIKARGEACCAVEKRKLKLAA